MIDPRSWRALGAVLPACLAICVSLASPLARGADDWAQEGQDAGSGSQNSDQTVLHQGNLEQMVKLWQRDLDIWSQSTGIVVADGQVFVGRKIAAGENTVQQQLLRLDLETGATVWKVDTPGGFGTPVLTPRLVIVADNDLGQPTHISRVRAFDRASGKKRWEYVHPSPSTSFLAPHVLDGVVYLVSLDGDTVALDAATGALRWRNLHDADCCGTNGLAVADGVVVVSRQKGMLALDATDGHALWRHDLPEFHIAAVRPMIVNGAALLFDLDGRLHAYELASGAPRWEVLAPAGDFSRPLGPMATDGARVFVLTGVAKPRLSAIDLTTGATLWSWHEHVWSHNPIVSDGVLYLPNDKHLLARDPATGTALPIARLPSMRWTEPVIADGHVLLSGGPVRAYGLDAPSRPAAAR